MRVLGLETSCDETAAAVVEDGRRVLSSVIHSQIPLHQRFGGVVPEIASRDHLIRVLPVIEEALRRAGMTLGQVDALAVTGGPGLIGSLLIGLQTAKGLALATGKPLTFVNHVEAHTAAAFLYTDGQPAEAPLPFPHLALAVSGGHSSLFLVTGHTRRQLVGYTMDDAPGESFDKVAKLLGLPYPGGVSVEKAAQGGDLKAVRLPRPRVEGRPNLFSFSGLKTAVRYHVESLRGQPAVPGTALGASLAPQQLADLCASFQEAVCDVLVERSLDLARQHGARAMVVSGGVAANSRLRERFNQACAAAGLQLKLVDRAYCTDNAAMIAGLGFHQLLEQGPAQDWITHDAFSNLVTKGANLR
jgi:N6-L-threonylcarbamoyladenine synthase